MVLGYDEFDLKGIHPVLGLAAITGASKNWKEKEQIDFIKSTSMYR